MTAFSVPGRFFKGNLHTHSNRSDGARDPESVCAVYRDAGFSPGYRTGRSVGYSFLESPELKRGELTVVEAGMTFAVDGGITVEGKFGGRIGDSVVVTESGFDYLTPYPRQLTVL